MANLAELFKSCKYLSPLNVVCVLKIITFRFTLNYNISFYNSLTFRFGGLSDKLREKGYLFFFVIDKDKLLNIITSKCGQEMINSRNNLSDDFLLLDDRNLISEAVSFPSDYNRKIFFDIISDYANYYSCFDYWKTGENDQRIIEQILKRYPYITKIWYKQTPIEDIVLPETIDNASNTPNRELSQ